MNAFFWYAGAALILTAIAVAAVFALGRLVKDAATGRIFAQHSAVPPRAVIIILGAKVYGDRPSDVLADRLDTGLALFQQGKAQAILVTGEGNDRDSNYDESGAMRQYLAARGVPAAAILTDPAGLRTLDSMLRAVSVFKITSAIVVTQHYHLPRALYLAIAAGIDAAGVAADRRSYVGARRYARREALARALAVADVEIFARRARPHKDDGRVVLNGPR